MTISKIKYNLIKQGALLLFQSNILSVITRNNLEMDKFNSIIQFK